MNKTLIIACDGEAASGKSTGAKLVSKKYNLLLINSGLYYRYATKLCIKFKPKRLAPFLKKNLNKISYSKIVKMNLHTEEISKNVTKIAKQKSVRMIINKIQKKQIQQKKRICLEGRDIASKILKKNPKYDIAFYFTCSLNIASKRRWLDLKKKTPFDLLFLSLAPSTTIEFFFNSSPTFLISCSFMKGASAIIITTSFFISLFSL